MSMIDDPSRDQNSLGGPTPEMLPGMGAGLDGGTGSSVAPGSGGFMDGTQSFTNTNVDPPAVSPAPQIKTNVDPPAVPSSAPPVTPKVLPNPPTTPDAPHPGAGLPTGPATGGFDGGSLGSPSGGALPGAGGAGGVGGATAKVGLDGGATAAGPGQFFADGGEVGDDDGSDPQGAMGSDPYTQLISAAMQSVDKTFEYGRQKNGLTQQAGAMPTKPGQQSNTPGSATKPRPGGTERQDNTDFNKKVWGVSQNDSDQDDVPGASASAADGDQDDEGAA